MAVNYTSEELLLQSGNTVTTHINKSFQLYWETIKARLLLAKS
jgi:hypothetical protein